MPVRINTGQYGAARVVPGSTTNPHVRRGSIPIDGSKQTAPKQTAPRQSAPRQPAPITTRYVAVGRGGYTRYVVGGKEYKNKNEAEIAAAIPTQARGGAITVTQESLSRGSGPKEYTVGGKTYTSRAQALAASRGVALEQYSTRGGTGVAHRVSETAQAQAQAPAPAQVRSSSGRGIGGTNLFGKALHGLIPGTITDPNKGGLGGLPFQVAKPTPPPELPDFTQGADRTGQRTVAKPPTISSTSLAGLSDRGTVSADTSGAARAVSQAAAAARSTGGVGSGSGNFKGVGAGSGNFNTNVGGRGVTASIRNREGISTDVGPQYQLEQLQVNQDLQGRAAAQSTAAHGIRADLPGRVAAQRLTEGRGQTRGRASTILTSGGARGLGSTPANTLGARRLVSGRTPATPVEGTQAGEAAAAQAGVQQRQGIRAEQDRQALRNTPQTSDVRSAGARQTSRREALIGGTGGSVSGGPGGAGGGLAVAQGPRNLSARQQRTQALNAELDEQRRVAEVDRQQAALGGVASNEATRARAASAAGAGAAARAGPAPPDAGFQQALGGRTLQTSDTRSAGARRTSRREALIGGAGGSVSGGPGGAGGGGNGSIFSGSGLAAQDGGDPRLGAARQRRPGNRDQTARATGQAAASRSRQGGRPPQRGNVPERVRARRTLLGGG